MQTAKLTRNGNRITLTVKHTDSEYAEQVCGERNLDEWVAQYDRTAYPTDHAWMLDARNNAERLAARRKLPLDITL